MLLYAILGLIFSLIVLGISIGISIGVSQPFTGALVRLRANYLPKAVSLDNVLEDGALATGDDSEDDIVNGTGAPRHGRPLRSPVSPRAISAYFLRERQSTAKIGPVVSGIIAMLIRTRKLEGWAGIYKGSAPVACQLLLLGFFTILFFQASGGLAGVGGGAYRASPSGPGNFGFWTNLVFMVLTSIVALPLNVIMNRAIVHPRILTFRQPRDNLRELLSYSEYSQPWRLYTLPGLLPAQLFHIAWIGFATRIIRHITVPSLGGLPPSTPATPDQDTYSGPESHGTMSISPIGLTVFLAWCVISVIVLSPIEVIMVRLSVQRPERQQPLHLAYARVPVKNASTAGPAPYNNQAAVSQDGDHAQRQDSNGTAAASAPASVDPAPRPSFAVDDEDEDEEGDAKIAESTPLQKDSKKDATAQADTDPAQPDAPTSRVTGHAPNNDTPNGTAQNGFYTRAAHMAPSEPVIALRPCDEPLSAEDAARAESEGFGAPTVERYTGLVDCLSKLVDEEGVEALYRGAWVTMLFMLAGNFS